MRKAKTNIGIHSTIVKGTPAIIQDRPASPMRCSRADSAGPVVGQGACPLVSPPDNLEFCRSVNPATKKAPPERDQLVLPTKEPLGAVGHPFVDLGFLVWRDPQQLLRGCNADKLLHLLGLFAFLEFCKGGQAFILRLAFQEFAH